MPYKDPSMVRLVQRNGNHRRRQAALARQLDAGKPVERCQLCGDLVSFGNMGRHEGQKHYDGGALWFVYIRGNYHFDVSPTGWIAVSKDGDRQDKFRSRSGTVAGLVRACKRWLLAHAFEQLALELEDQVVMGDGSTPQ